MRDDLRLFAIWGDGLLLAMAPMMLSRRPGRLPFCTRERQFLGADMNLTELRGMLAKPGWEAATATAKAQHLATRREWEWDWVQWHGLPADGPVPPGIDLNGGVDDFVLYLSSDWASFRAHLPRNIKESLRKCYNALQRDGHAWTVRVLQGRSAVPALQQLVTMHKQRASRNDTIRHDDVFADPRAQGFMADYVQQTPGAWLFALDIAGQPVAMRLGFVYDRELYLYYSGYDQAWAQHSVMTTLVSEALRWAIDAGLERVNLSTGADVSKLRWRPTAVPARSGTQLGPGRRRRLAFQLTQALRQSRWQ